MREALKKRPVERYLQLAAQTFEKPFMHSHNSVDDRFRTLDVPLKFEFFFPRLEPGPAKKETPIRGIEPFAEPDHDVVSGVFLVEPAAQCTAQSLGHSGAEPA